MKRILLVALILLLTLGNFGSVRADLVKVGGGVMGGGGGGGGVSAGGLGAGCTASTLLWVDSGGLVQCGATATATGTTSLIIGTAGSVGTLGFNTANYGLNFNTALDAGAVHMFAANNHVGSWGTSASFFGIFTPSGANIGASGTAVASGVDIGLTRLAANVYGLFKDTSLTSGGWLQNSGGEASLAANYTNATATLSATNLSYTVISGRHYNFDLEVHLTESTAADGVQIAFDGGSAAATDFVVDCDITNTGGAVAMANSFATALATVINATTTTVTTQTGLHCHGMFTPSGAGTFILRAAQNTHSTGTLTFLKGSSLAMRDSKVL